MMLDTQNVLKNEELAVFRLRALYRTKGYTPYKMSKFEEYDLYARNKQFLVSENVITFTDTNGKLMALKPDVTLSIIKNGKDTSGTVQKLYYDEHVYRVSKGTHSFKELMQVGLECIGDVDDYCICEVLSLAADSLAQISDDYVLDLSDMELLGTVLADLSLDDQKKDAVLQCIGEKNLHGVIRIAAEAGLPTEQLDRLKALLAIKGNPAHAIGALRALLPENAAEIERLARVITALEKHVGCGKVRLDFSVVNNMSYYNGLVFQGFVKGVPASVLSGGQYDRLMQKMNRRAKAIGFAVYLDLLERLGEGVSQYDVDAVLLYDESCEPATLLRAADALTASGKRVSVQRSLPENLKYKELLQLRDGEVCVLETNA